MGPEALLTAEDLVVGYHGRGILPPIALDILPGELWLLAGRNGSGKSTLLRTLLGLLPPVHGQVRRRPGTEIAFLSQRHRLDPLLPMRAIDVVAQGTERNWSFLKPWLSGQQRQRIQRALAMAGAEALARRRFTTLSEGQKQRVLLAQAIAAGANLLVLDEPTAAMDMTAEQETMARLDNLRRETGAAILLVSHDLGAAMERADRMAFVDAEHRHVAVGPTGQVSCDPYFRRQFALPLGGVLTEQQVPVPDVEAEQRRP